MGYNFPMTDTASLPQIPDDVVTFASGGRMPLLGFGTWQITGDEAVSATATALEVGYRHLDTATVYENEGEVGHALSESGIARDDVFVTTKCPPHLAGQEIATLERSLELLGTDHVDLWLMHWPPNAQATPSTWQAFRELRDEGLARAIGVSNYSLAQIDELIEVTGEAPAVNQIPWSPRDFDAWLLAELTLRGVVLEGYSPLKRTDATTPLLAEISERHGATVQQVVLAWHLAHRVVVIPKSTNPQRIEANLDVLGFTLSDEEVAAIDALSIVER